MVGMVRLMYPFFGGLLLSRLGWLIRLEKRAFWWCSLLIVVVLSIPRIGGEDGYWMNGLYEAFCIICIFPVIVSMGAGGKVTGKRSTAVCKFLGDIPIRFISPIIRWYILIRLGYATITLQWRKVSLI